MQFLYTRLKRVLQTTYKDEWCEGGRSPYGAHCSYHGELSVFTCTRDLLQNGTLCVRQVRVSLTLYTFIEGVLCIVGYHFIFCVQRNS